VIRLPAVADAGTTADMPAQNAGTDVEVTCGKAFDNGPPFRVWMTRGHFRFDLGTLAELPVQATLNVYQRRAMAAGCLDVTAHRITQSWSEATVTWTNQPAHDVSVARACVGDSFAPGFKSFDLTLLVQGWIQGAVPNFGVVIRDPDESPAGAARPLHAASREDADLTHRPYLELRFADTFGTGCRPGGPVPTLRVQNGAPAVGSLFELRGLDLVPGDRGGFLVGASNTVFGPLTLPLGLGFAGFPGCRLLVAPDATVDVGMVASPGALLSVTVPRDASLPGLAVFFQALSVGASLAMTDGLGVVLR
jgi:hypothetical protein